MCDEELEPIIVDMGDDDEYQEYCPKCGESFVKKVGTMRWLRLDQSFVQNVDKK